MVKSVFEDAVQDTESPDWADGLPALRAGALARLSLLHRSGLKHHF